MGSMASIAFAAVDVSYDYMPFEHEDRRFVMLSTPCSCTSHDPPFYAPVDIYISRPSHNRRFPRSPFVAAQLPLY